MAEGCHLLVSAPGKVILHGEHAVVYGKPALAASVDLRCYMLLHWSDSPLSPGITLNLPDLGLNKSWLASELCRNLNQPLEADEHIQALRQFVAISDEIAPSTGSIACLVFLYLLSSIYGDKLKDLSGLEFTVVASLPAGAGLGSSAAFSVCLAAGMLCHSGTITNLNHLCDDNKEQSPKSPQTQSGTSSEQSDSLHSSLLPAVVREKMEKCGLTQFLCQLLRSGGNVRVWNKVELDVINKWGFEAERLIHGTPSGIDNSVSTFGGAIRFEGGKITCLERMPQLRVLLINTKVPRSTKKMVSGVRERYNKFPDVIQPILDSIEGVVNSAMQTFSSIHAEASDHTARPQDTLTDLYGSLQELFDVNHHLLNALGVGHSNLDQVCQTVGQFGLTGKLTGGGGGGCAIALVPPECPEEKLSSLIETLLSIGCECWTTVVGSRGVSQHQEMPPR